MAVRRNIQIPLVLYVFISEGSCATQSLLNKCGCCSPVNLSFAVRVSAMNIAMDGEKMLPFLLYAIIKIPNQAWL